MKIRNATLDDAATVKAITDIIYPIIPPYTEMKIKAQITNYPEGTFAVQADNGEVVGYSACLRTLEDVAKSEHSWIDITGYGFASTHIPDGEVIYGYEFCIDPAFRRKGYGTALYNARKELCRQTKVKGMFIAARMPGFSTYSLNNPQTLLSAEAYAEAVESGSIYDPVLTFQLEQGFKLVRLLRNYNLDDMESFGYAALLFWKTEG